MALKKIVMIATNKKIEKYAKKILELEKEEVHVKSGALKSSLSIEKKSDGHFLVGVDADKLKLDPRNKGGIDYSPHYLYGHRGYIIRPVRAKALRWVGKDGKVHYSQMCRIPPHPGDPFIQRVIVRRPRFY